MKGHVRKRGKGWALVVDAGAHPAQRCEDCGRRVWVEREKLGNICACGGTLGDPKPERRQVWQSGFTTRKAAEAELRQFLTRLDTGGDPFPEQVTLRAFAERWMEHMESRIRPRTAYSYRQLLRDHLLPVMGDLRLDRIRPAHVQHALDQISAQGLAPRTVVKARGVLGGLMRSAQAWGLIVANPVQAVRPPRPERPRLDVPTADQLMDLVSAARGTLWEAPMLLAVATGARRSEVLGATWADVDLETGKLRVTRGLQRVNGELVFTQPKTDRARREIGLPRFALEPLRQHRAAQLVRRMALGPAWVDLGLVCDRGDGGPIHPDSFTHAFKKLAAKVGIPAGARLHDTRHGVATALLSQGLHPAITSASLGHASPAFTMSTYQHVLDGMGSQAAAALDAALGEAR
jgi:integrase